jgi:putative ABC transport system ATP-binding protein
MAPVIELRNLSHAFGDGSTRKTVLNDVSLELNPGELVILTGPSGSGKSTLLTLVGALRSVQSGHCRVFGHELRNAKVEVLNQVRRRVGYIFQHHNLLPFLTARENVELSVALAPDSPPAETRRARALQLLADVGLTPEVNQYPSTLSGGQRQRVALARALAHQPGLVLADEPTAALDRQSGHQAVELLRGLARERKTPVLLVTHDARILDVADRILHFEDGHLVAGA